MKKEIYLNANSFDSIKENISDNLIGPNKSFQLKANFSKNVLNNQSIEENFSSNNYSKNKFLEVNFKKGEDLRESLLGNNYRKNNKNFKSIKIKNNFIQKNLNLEPPDVIVNPQNFHFKNSSKNITNKDKDTNHNSNFKDNFNYQNNYNIKNINYKNNDFITSNTHTKTKETSLIEDRNKKLMVKGFTVSETDDFGASAANLQFPTKKFFSSKNLTILKQKLNFYFDKLQGFVYILFGCFLGTLTNFFYKYATQNGVEVTQLLLYRGINFTLFSSMYIYFYFPELKQQFDKKHINLLISRALMSSIGTCLFLTSFNYLRLSTLEVLLRTGNLMSVFLGYYMINEVVTRWDLFSLFGTFIGIIFILKPDFIFGEAEQSGRSPAGDTAFGIFLALFCACLFAISNILTKKLLNSFNEIYLILFIGITSIFFGILLIEVKALDFGIGVFFAFYCAFVSLIEFFSFFYTLKSFKLESVTKLSPFLNSRIVFSVILTYAFYGQIDFYDFLGSAIIVAIYIYSSYKKIN